MCFLVLWFGAGVRLTINREGLSRRAAGWRQLFVGRRRQYALAFFAGQLVLAVALFGGSVIAARLLGPEGKGIYTAWATATGAATVILAGPLTIGFGRAYLDGQARELLIEACSHAGLAFVVTASLSGVLIGLGVPPLPVVACLTIAVPASLAARDLVVALQAAKRAWSLQAVRIVDALTYTGGLGIVAVLHLAAPLSWAYTFWALGSLAAAALAAFYTWRYFGFTREGDLRRVRQLGRGSYGAYAGDWFLLRTDWLVALVLGGPTALGIYSVAVNWSEAGLYAGNAIGGAVFEDHRTLKPTQVHHILRRTTYLLAGVSVVIAAAGFFAVGVIFGAQFQDARWPLLLLAPGVAARGVAFTGSQILLAQGHGRAVSTITLHSLLAGVVVRVLATVAWGIVGTAAATTLIYCLQALAVKKVATARSARLVVPPRSVTDPVEP